MKKLLKIIPSYFILPLFLLGGVAVGLGAYTIYVARLHTYASDDSATCVNCHVMAPYYNSWSNSSHAVWTSCNDCHVPHTSTFDKYLFKAMDGLYHSAVFTLRTEPDVIRTRKSSSQVIMANCIRCHTQLNTEFVDTGMVDYAATERGEGKACWDCHRDVPHTTVGGNSSAPHAIVPMPDSAVPEWLKSRMNNR